MFNIIAVDAKNTKTNSTVCLSQDASLWEKVNSVGNIVEEGLSSGEACQALLDRCRSQINVIASEEANEGNIKLAKSVISALGSVPNSQVPNPTSLNANHVPGITREDKSLEWGLQTIEDTIYKNFDLYVTSKTVFVFPHENIIVVEDKD